MTKKLKILLISVLFLVATVCVSLFAGCKVKYTVDELKEKYKLTAQITYFLNSDGGQFGEGESDDGNDIYVKNLYYKTGALPMDLGNTGMINGSSSTDLTPKKGYKFLGWYIVETDSSGAPLYAADENDEKKVYSEGETYDIKRGMSSTGKPFDFTKPLEEGEHIYLCGDFEGDVKVELRLLCEEYGDDKFDQITYQNNGEEVTVKDRDKIEYGCINIPKAGIDMASYSRSLQSKLTDYTVLDFYQYDEDTNRFTSVSAIKYPEADEDDKPKDVVVYLQVLKGNWQILSSYSDVKRMFGWGDERYYLKQDIDCEWKTVSNLSSFSGTLYGGKEAHSIKNLTVQTQGNATIENRMKASMFGTIESSAVLENVTFENVTANFTVKAGHDPVGGICFIANTIEENATFKNVSVSGSLNIKLSSATSHATNTKEDNWLFGNKDTATFKEITVTQATCTIIGHDDETVDTFTFNNNNKTEDLS